MHILCIYELGPHKTCAHKHNKVKGKLILDIYSLEDTLANMNIGELGTLLSGRFPPGFEWAPFLSP